MGQDTANFIDLALSGGGKELVNCFAGVSRSATIAVSYLIQKKGMTVEEALVTVKTNRDVHPNKGFLSKLIQLEELSFCACVFASSFDDDVFQLLHRPLHL